MEFCSSKVCKEHHVLLGDGVVDVDLVLLVEVEVPGVGLPGHAGHDGGRQGPGVDVRPVGPGEIPEMMTPLFVFLLQTQEAN